MPRKLHLEKHLTTDDLKALYQKSTSPVELRRWHLLWLVADGWTLTEAANIVGLSYHYAREIIQSYNQRGAKGVISRRNRQALCPCESHQFSNDQR